MAHAAPGTGREPVGKRRAALQFIALVAFVLFLAPLAAAGGLILALRDGEIGLDPFRERLEQLVASRMGGGVGASIGGVALQSDPDGLRLHIRNVALRDGTGREIVSAPDAALIFEPLQLLRLDFRPARVVFNGLAMTARLEPAATNDAVDWRTRARVALTSLGRHLRDNRQSDWTALAFRNAALTLDTGELLGVVTLTGWSMSASGGGDSPVVFSGVARIEGEPISYSIATSIRDADTEISLQLDNPASALLRPRVARLSKGAAFEAKSRLEASLLFDANGEIRNGGGTLSLSEGRLATDIPQMEPFAFDLVSASARWLGASDRIEEVSWKYIGNGHRLEGAGALRLPDDTDPSWRYGMTSERWLVAGATAADAEVTADRISMSVSLPRNLSALRIDSLSVSGPGTSITGEARLGFAAEGQHLTLELAARTMPGRVLLSWWPSMVATPARAFFVRNLVEGVAESLDISLDLPPADLKAALALKALPRDSFRLNCRFQGAAIRVIDGLPPLHGLSGAARVDAKSGDGAVSSGILEFAPGKRITFSDGTFSLSALDTSRPSASFDFRAQAPLDHALDLMARPQMSSAFTLGIPASDAKGAFSGRIAISLPLADKLGPRDIQTTFNGTLTGVTLDKAIGQDRLENATLSLSGDSTGIEIKGEGRWQSSPVTIRFEKDSADGSTEAVLGLTLDEAALRRRGVDLGGGLKGPVPVIIRATTEVTGPDGREGERRTRIEADLTRATLRNLVPGLQKPAGRPAKLSFEATERGRVYALQNIAFDSGPTSIRGEAQLEAEKGLRSAKLGLLRISPGDNIRAEIDRTGTVTKVTIRGNNFDARPFLKPETDREGPTEPDIDLDLKTTLLSGFNGEVFTSPELRLSRRAGEARSIQFTARIGGQPISVQGTRPGTNGLPLSVEGGDAGAFYRFLDIYTRMHGGDIVGEITLGANRLGGIVLSRNFELRDEPAIRRLIAADPRIEGQLASANRARFTKMRLEFQKVGSLMTLREAVIFGPQIGLNFSGTIDQVRDRISLSGTFIPAFGLNNAFSQLPLVGGLLGGGRNEGLLGITFSATGQLSRPNIAVNPLSAVAPGIFRKIFEFRNDATPAPAVRAEEPSSR
jgi:hypothetical protein